MENIPKTMIQCEKGTQKRAAGAKKIRKNQKKNSGKPLGQRAAGWLGSQKGMLDTNLTLCTLSWNVTNCCLQIILSHIAGYRF